MKLPQSLKNMSLLEIVLFLAFVLYIILPVSVPLFMQSFVKSYIGLLVFFCITVVLFVYTNPLLGVLYIFVVYEIIRRSSETFHNPRAVVLEYEPSQESKDEALRKMNPPSNVKTVEEEVIAARAPLNKSYSVDIVQTSFKPVSKMIEGASPY
jgi:predicted membrane protein